MGLEFRHNILICRFGSHKLRRGLSNIHALPNIGLSSGYKRYTPKLNNQQQQHQSNKIKIFSYKPHFNIIRVLAQSRQVPHFYKLVRKAKLAYFSNFVNLYNRNLFLAKFALKKQGLKALLLLCFKYGPQWTVLLGGV